MGSSLIAGLNIAFYVLFFFISLVQIFRCIQFIITRPLFRPPFVLLLTGTVILLARWATLVGLYTAVYINGSSQSDSLFAAVENVTLSNGILGAIADALIVASPFILVYYCTRGEVSSAVGTTGTKNMKVMMKIALAGVVVACLASIAQSSIYYVVFKHLADRDPDDEGDLPTFSNEIDASRALSLTTIGLYIVMLVLLVVAVWPNRRNHSGRLVLFTILPLLILQEAVLIADTILRIVDIDLAKTEEYSLCYGTISSIVDPLLVALTLRIGERSIANTRLVAAPKRKRLPKPANYEGSLMEEELLGVENINVKATVVENKC